MTPTHDPKLTAQMQAWLQAEPAGRDLRQGAEMLLRLTRNRILYNNILRRPDKMAAKLEYELRKHLRIRLDGLTRQGVVLMEREVMPRAAATLASGQPSGSPDGSPISHTASTNDATASTPSGMASTPDATADHEISTEADHAPALHAGRRADHDRLPAEVQKLWDDNAELWFRLKQTYNQLLTMEKATPCDRYEYLKQLDTLDRRYRANLQAYDAYQPEAAPNKKEAAKDEKKAPKAETKAPKAEKEALKP